MRKSWLLETNLLVENNTVNFVGQLFSVSSLFKPLGRGAQTMCIAYDCVRSTQFVTIVITKCLRNRASKLRNHLVITQI